jgi:hypothetical protein
MRRWPRLIVAPKAIGGFLAGLLLWWGLSGPYDEFLAGMAEPLVRALERFPATHLQAWNGYILVFRPEFLPGAPKPAVSAGHLTANIVLLSALFATNRRPVSLRNVSAFALAALILAGIHVLAVVANVESIYAWDLGAWSSAHYGIVERRMWEAATNFYTLVGAFGSAFLLWWLSCTLSANASLSHDPPQRRASAGQR